MVRPDPDALLAQVRQQTRHAAGQPGHLKIFFGFAPGVGKTYAMLEAAQRRLAAGDDVLAGMVVTHGRTGTAGRLAGLPVLPARRLDYRGTVQEEFDLDAALARAPQLILLDELAHTNVPGSRHGKRHLDVEELLEHGIDVYTTLNVQHLESLNDVLAQITGIRVRETVPDAALQRADEIELIDLPLDELLERLAAGAIYGEAQAAAASAHFFTRQNLLALRELALRCAADRVDVDVRAQRALYPDANLRPLREKVMVCVGHSPDSAALLRATCRLATNLRAPWLAVYVEGARPPAAATRDDAASYLAANLRLAEVLGAEVVRLGGSEVDLAVLDCARQQGVSRIVVGKPTHGRWRDRLRGSLVEAIIRGSGSIDVHVISGSGQRPAPGQRPATGAMTEQTAQGSAERGQTRGYLIALAYLVAATGLGLLLRPYLAITDVTMIYLAGIIRVAVYQGRGPALAAALTAVVSFDFCFVPPIGSLAVHDAHYLPTCVIMAAVGVSLSTLGGRLRQQERLAHQRERTTYGLYSLARALTRAADAAQVYLASTQQIAAAFHLPCGLMVAGPAGAPQVAAGVRLPPLGSAQAAVVQWVLHHGRPAGLGTETLPATGVLCLPVGGPGQVVAALLLVPERPASLSHSDRHLLTLYLDQVEGALQRLGTRVEAP